MHPVENKHRVLTPGHEGWNILYNNFRIIMELYLLHMYLNFMICDIIMAT